MAGSSKAVLLWDPRVGSDGKVNVRKLTSHDGWVEGLAWEPRSGIHLASCGYDGCLKIWDLRSDVPLQTIQVKEQNAKLLCCAWYQNDENKLGIVCGGEDKTVHFHKVFD